MRRSFTVRTGVPLATIRRGMSWDEPNREVKTATKTVCYSEDSLRVDPDGPRGCRVGIAGILRSHGIYVFNLPDNEGNYEVLLVAREHLEIEGD